MKKEKAKGFFSKVLLITTMVGFSTAFLVSPGLAQPDTTLPVVCEPTSPEGCYTCNVITENTITSVASTDLVLCSDLSCLAPIDAVVPPPLTLSAINIDGGCVKVLTTNPLGVDLGAGSSLLTVTMCLDPGVQPGQCCPITLTDDDGDFDFEQPIPPIPAPTISWESPGGEICLDVAEEVECFDGIDNDEDGLTDCEDPDCDRAQNGTCDTGLPGICRPGTLICVAGSEQCVPNSDPLPEICDNGVDDDCDGLTDGEDPDCLQIPPNCGDGRINWRQGETCDPPGSICGARGNPQWQCIDACRCVFTAGFCGDGVIQWKRGEQCEPSAGLDRCGPGRICIDCRCVRVVD